MNNGAHNNSKPTELDELREVPTDVLRWWVTDRARCLWENAIGKAPEWTGDATQDRDAAATMCAGCPVRAECLELERRTAEHGDDWSGALHPEDRRVLREMWDRRLRADVEAMSTDGGDAA